MRLLKAIEGFFLSVLIMAILFFYVPLKVTYICWRDNIRSKRVGSL